ncbi:MAG: flagellin [Sphingomonas oligoaromativorans]|jgi:flagellin|uniref:flagellin n=1 Tax=Sphingomonas oligoaromativorans TaxID=575322 RepID=UPI00141DE8BF|nr:flagellin [Sphingomonas oligoaromativorans]NIJ34722.1 flagellin [Sphingomonas oligoaromativorans]
MSFSVNTNIGAMTALQSLNQTNKSMATTQSRINTGLAVASTKDDSAAFNIAQGLRGDISGLSAVTSSLNNAKSVTDVAISGAESISDILNQMKTLAAKSDDDTLTTDQRDQYNTDFTNLRDQITTIVDSSDFNGINLLKSGGGSVSALQSLQGGSTSPTNAAAWDPSTLDVDNVDLGLGGSTITIAATDDIGTQADAHAMLSTLKTSSDNLASKLSDLGSASRTIDRQLTFTSKLSDALESGVGNLVDADLAKESANLQALQVKQQLGVQALSIANQAPQTILSLFR